MTKPFPFRRALGLALVALVQTEGCRRDDGEAVAVVVSLPDQRVSGAAKVTIEVDYSGTGASIVSEAGIPSCAFILPGVEGDFADDRKGKLTIHTQGPRAARGPADIAACRMRAGDHDATAADLKAKLDVRLAAAEDAAGKPIDLAVKSSGRGQGSPARSEAQVEALQAEAAKAAAALAPSPPPPPGSAVAGGAKPGELAARIAQGLPMPATPGPAAGTAARPGAASSGSARPGGAGSAPAIVAGAAVPPPSSAPDYSQVPGSQDRDPGYDDSDGDNPNMPAYDLEVAVVSEGRLGALQLKITHLGGRGGFIGRGGQVDCVSLVEAMMAANYSGERLAQLGLVSIQGFRTPASVVRCGFRSGEPLSPASFLVEVVDASDTGTETAPLDPMPTAAILSITRR
jgi:hypothetical protein